MENMGIEGTKKAKTSTQKMTSLLKTSSMSKPPQKTPLLCTTHPPTSTKTKPPPTKTASEEIKMKLPGRSEMPPPLKTN